MSIEMAVRKFLRTAFIYILHVLCSTETHIAKMRSTVTGIVDNCVETHIKEAVYPLLSTKSCPHKL